MLSNLCVSRIRVKNVGEELAGACDTSDDKTVYIEAIHYKEMGQIESVGIG